MARHSLLPDRVSQFNALARIEAIDFRCPEAVALREWSLCGAGAMTPGASAAKRKTGGGIAPVKKVAKARDPIDAEVGHRIRIHRNARGMSQTALGEKLGVTFQQVQKYERGVNRVGAGRLTRIAGILAIPVGALLGVEAERPKTQSSSAGSNVLECLSMAGAVRLVQAYAQLATPALRSTIVNLVEQVAHAKTEQ